MKADAYDLTTIFAVPRQLFIPIFQRPYVWKKEEQWKPLWDDLTTIANHLVEERQKPQGKKVKPHFLGAIVLDQHPSPVGKPDARSVIDGQQRLTTVQILLMAMRDVLPNTDDCRMLRGSLEELVYNKYVSSDDDKLKVLPTNVDEAVYRAVACTQTPGELDKHIEENKLSPDSRIAEAYKYFHASAAKWIDFTAEDWLVRAEALVDALRQRMRIVVIDMDDQDEAQVIFETLNARGTPLLEIDLVKNHVFRMAKEEGHDINNLYRKHWQRFEDDNGFWREREIRQGRLKRPVIELYLQHYLAMSLKDDVPATKLFDTFKEWAFNNSDKTAPWHLEQLGRYGVHFKHFMEVSTDSEEGMFFKRLNIMETTTIFPFLLSLYEKTSSTPKYKNLRLEVLKMLESFLVRRMVCRLTTKNYNKLCVSLQQQIDKCKVEDIADKVSAFLSKSDGESVRWPDDKEFRESWLNKPLYNDMTVRRLRMLLRGVEDNMPNSKTEGVYIKQRLTIEHIMPQAWEHRWPLPVVKGENPIAFEERKAARNRRIQTLGNLTLLTQPLNSGVSNRPFKEKMKEVLVHSKLNLNISLNEYDDWNEDNIKQRAGELFAVAKKVWRSPDAK